MAVKRYGMVLGIKPEHLEEYRRLHADVWPAVLARIAKSNIRNYWRFSVLPPDETTIAHVLAEAGYTTAAVGKWQLHAAPHYDWAGAGASPEQAGSPNFADT